MVSTRTGWPGTGMGDIRYCNDCRTRCLLRRDPSAPVLASDESYLRRAAVNASVDLIRARRAERIVALTEAAAIIGIAAGIGLVLYFVGAIVSHLRVGDVKGTGSAAFMFVLAAGALALRLLTK